MPTLNTPKEIINAFIEGRKPTKRLASLIVAKDEVYSYGPHYPLVIRNENTFYVNTQRYSATTNRHIQAAQCAMEEHNLTSIGFQDKDGFTFEVFA